MVGGRAARDDVPEGDAMSLKRVLQSIGGSLVKGAPVKLVTSEQKEPSPEQKESSADELYAAFWEHLANVEPKAWDLEGFYQRIRNGQPVSEKPCVAVISPTYRETESIAKRGRISRNAVRTDLAEHGIASITGGIDGDSLVCRMRQRACHLFLSSPATHLLFWDADIVANDPGCVRKMLATGHDVIAGACPFKDMSGRTVHNLFPEHDGKPIVRDEHGCVEVQDAGTGFLLVSRKALIALQKAHPERMHMSVSRSNDRGAPLWALFDTAVVDGIYCSEDYYFSHLWQQLGGSVYVYSPATFQHWGEVGYEASFEKQYGLT
jgi:hypothetical protein